MNQEFPFDHFLKNTNTIDTRHQVNNNRELTKDEGTSNFSQSELDVIDKEILNLLEGQINAQKFSAFFKSTFALSKISTSSVTFYVTTPFIKTMIETQYLDILQESVRQILGRDYTIELLVTDSSASSLSSNDDSILNPVKNDSTNAFSELIRTAEKTQVKSNRNESNKFTLNLNETRDDLLSKVESQYIDHMNSDYSGIVIDPNKTFDNFVVGPSNQLAFATAIAVGDAPGKNGKYPCLYIHSDSGLGKTHLLHAVANGIREKFPELAICLITAREFMKEMIHSIQTNKLSEFQKKYSETIDVLMIDDIHELKNKQGTQNEFFHIFNELHNKGKQLIFTSDKAPKEIDGIEERVKTRLQWGLVIDIQRPDLETRIAILKRKAYELDLFLNDDAFTLIASNIMSSIRELEGSLIKLSAFADVMKVEIDTDMVKDLLNLSNIEESRDVSLESIAKAVSQYFKIPLADIKSRARTKEIVRSRHIAMYLSKKIINATLKEIAKFYGNRDHSSVIHGVNKISEHLKSDRELSKDLICIENNI